MPNNLISAFLIVRNEEDNIERCLNSIAWVNEIVVVDSFSTDKTLEICKRFTTKIFQRPFLNYSDQKNFALSQISNEWGLSIDADEVVTNELQAEIKHILAHTAPFNAYSIPRQSHIFGRKFKYSGTQNDRPIRLLRKNFAAYEQPVHEILNIQGKIGALKHRFDHFTYSSLTQYFLKFDRYTSLEAEFLLKKSYRLKAFDYFIRPLGKFMKQYFWEQGFRDGWEGFLFAFLSAWYVFIKYAKYRELLIQQTRSIKPIS